jgi:UDP-glucose 4-epimerase
VLELVEVLRKLGREMKIIGVNDPFEPQFAPARAGEVQRSSLDPRKSREVLGFDARVGLEDGMRRTLEWVVAEHDAQLRAQAS